ncbi:5-oxoprolinase subunit PxpB [Flagellimonas allohymeniacidonis]|uniref:5-oxoprolinase subunit PxpB n=1 Tax=Flagellimonas allohymeniacidonis TaxID=2517819 RepID=A0A4Q8QL36_9FLAO|nr:5-oxoprolinase subunit PxpB [Allomuricauda hymeniacidonis]TAI48956.1 5-oxoprolinase subunit PxpB [Allomuricauda hymeniacidonis]
MKKYPITIKPFGERAILVEWPNQVEESILQDILGFTTAFEELGISGWELVPAYNSVTMIYNLATLDFDQIKQTVLDCYSKRNEVESQKERFLWKLPVCYDKEFGIDIEETAQKLELSVEQLIQEHTSFEYTVFGIGFLPGFMYLGGLPKTLELPRRDEPRLHVAKGSVGLAGKQTGIYPQDSPGGWNIIGNCPVSIFDASKEEPCFVSVGDKISFQAISRAEYDLHKIEGEVGIYKVEKIDLNA